MGQKRVQEMEGEVSMHLQEKEKIRLEWKSLKEVLQEKIQEEAKFKQETAVFQEEIKNLSQSKGKLHAQLEEATKQLEYSKENLQTLEAIRSNLVIESISLHSLTDSLRRNTKRRR